MIDISENLVSLLESRNSEVVIVCEIYSRDTIDISSISAPANAIARYSTKCFTWHNSTGSYDYDAKIVDIPSVKTFLSDQQNEAEILISNTKRGAKAGVNLVLNNKIKGTWLVLRLIFPELPDESWMIWWGKCLRPGKIDDKTVSLNATQEIGNYKIKIPFRTYNVTCPLTPGRGDCLGPKPLEEHTPLYQQQYALYGTMLCPDRQRSTCIKLGNEENFQGQPTVALSGTFSYIPKSDDDQSKKKKKNISKLKTESWSAMNQDENTSEVVNLGFGRFQIAGHPFTWADTGTEIRSLQGFCEGRIGDFDFIRCRNTILSLGNVIKHYGDYGNSGSQTSDILFGGLSGYNSKLAYLEVTVTGSNPENVDEAPLITAVIRGLQIPVPGVNGEYNSIDSSNNPVHIVRYLLTSEKCGRIPTYRIADKKNLLTAAYCDELVEDRSQCESIVLPDNEYNDYGVGYRRYRSTSSWTAYRDMYENEELPIDSINPDFEEPYIRWYRPYSQPPLLPEQNVIRQRFTVNGSLQEKTPLLEFLQKRIFPCFRGWLNYNKEGQIEIRTREPADNAFLRAVVPAGNDLIPVNNIKKWRGNRKGYLLIGVGNENTEVRKVEEVLYSPGCNELPISAVSRGTITINVSPIKGGSISSQGIGYIELQGEVTANSTITLRFNNYPNEFFISYTTDGIESMECVARMINAHLNANPDFSNYLTSYIIPTKPTRVYIRCEAGYLKLNTPLEFDHQLGEEVMRAAMIFENCNELNADTSSSFDNIIIDSFSWNDSGGDDDEINAYTALYTSAVDDFHVAKIIPRTSWDTIDLEGELNEEELDLKFVDNYWQAAYITKSTAIEKIDGNILFHWTTGISGFMLEMGDVVAVRHDSGNGVLRYTPIWIKSISFNLANLTTEIEGGLYLSGAWDQTVQGIDPVLTVSLNPDFVPFNPPEIGSTGGIGGASPLQGRVYPTYPYFRDSRYSPDGVDYI